MPFITDCPRCGQTLSLRAAGGQYAPYVCYLPQGCGRAWWRTELGDLARTVWDNSLESHDHTHPDYPQLRRRLNRERVFHGALASNLRPSEIALLDDPTQLHRALGVFGLPDAAIQFVIGALRRHEAGDLTLRQLEQGLSNHGLDALAQRWRYALESEAAEAE